MPEFWCKCPDPDDHEAWRQYTKCCAAAAVVVILVFGVIYCFLR